MATAQRCTKRIHSWALFLSAACVWRRGEIKCKIKKKEGVKKPLNVIHTRLYYSRKVLTRGDSGGQSWAKTLVYSILLGPCTERKIKEEITRRKRPNTSRWYCAMTSINNTCLWSWNRSAASSMANWTEKEKKLHLWCGTKIIFLICP